MRNIIRLVIVVAVVGIGVGAFVFRDRISGNVGELKVGDCFDRPAADVVSDLQHHPCNEPHDGEVLAVFDYPNPPSAYPGDDAIRTAVKDRCVDSAFTAYVGTSLDASPDIDLAFYQPKPENWGSDKQIVCYLHPVVAGTKVSTSYRAAATPSQ